jgi:hypothetical protein
MEKKIKVNALLLEILKVFNFFREIAFPCA